MSFAFSFTRSAAYVSETVLNRDDLQFVTEAMHRMMTTKTDSLPSTGPSFLVYNG